MPDENLITVTGDGKARMVSWQPTGALRIVTVRGQTEPGVLQQEWLERFSGNREWRTVPVIEGAALLADRDK